MKLAVSLFFICVSLGLGINYCKAEAKTLDSLEYLFSKEQNDLKKIDLLNQLFNVQYSTDFEKGLLYAKQALKISKALVDDDKNQKQQLISESSNNVGAAYLLLDDYEKSIEYLLLSLQVAESIKDTGRMSNALYNLSSVYDYKGDVDKANSYLEQVIALDEKRGDFGSAAVGYSAMATTYFFDDQYEKGMKYYEKAMDIFKPKNDLENMSILYGNRAVGLKKIKRFVEALKYHQLAIDLELKLNDKSGLVSSYLNIADTYIDMNKNIKAIEFNTKSLELAKELKSVNSIMLGYSGLAESYQLMGDKDKALEYLHLYANWKDTLYNQENAQAIAEMQTKYDSEKKEAENSLLKAETELDKVELEKKSSQQKMLMTGLGLALLIVIYIAYSLIEKKKINKVLNNQNEIIEEKNKDITDSINYAQRIQEAILPEETILKSNYESFIYYRPKDIVSGDFYWIKEIGDKIFFSVVDCTGHGVPGAFMSIIGANSLNRIIEDLKIEKTGEILDELNNLVNKAVGKNKVVEGDVSIRDGMDISICSIDKTNNKLEYSGANNSLYLLKKINNPVKGMDVSMGDDNALFYEIKPNKMAIGGGDNKINYETHSIQLDKEDVVYLFSDGYADQFGGEKGKKFMYKQFKKMLFDINNQPMDKQLIHIDKTMKDWRGDLDQLDDICVMGVRI